MRSGKYVIPAILFLNAIGALAAGYLFMTDPSGSKMGMNPDLLQYSPFSSFFIPGLVLFVANGLLSAVTLVLYFTGHRLATKAVLLQGVILCTWIFVQMIMLRLIHPLHLIMGAAGLLLIFYSLSKIK